MAPSRLQTNAVVRFSCLGAECPDTCCQGWGMQLTRETVSLYEQRAPELLEAVTSGEAEWVMRRDPATDICVRFDHGLCSIHRDYGTEFLGDACHFFPRVTRALGMMVVTSGTLSCPQMARLMLGAGDASAYAPQEEMRAPYSAKNYLPEGLGEQESLGMHERFLGMAADDSVPLALAFMRISAIARALEMQPVSAWPDALPFYQSMADSRIPAAEPAAADPFNLLHALRGLVYASPKPPEKLCQLIERMAQMLGVEFTQTGALVLMNDAEMRAVQALVRIKGQAATLEPLLRRYLVAQLSQALFPFAGLGNSLSERMTIIGVRLATLRLALATLPATPAEEDVLTVVQCLSRFMDHLADPQLSMQIYQETGWVREARLRSLVG